MKSKYIGIVILVVIVLAGGGYYFYRSQTKVQVINGYLGGEKIGLFEDEEIQEILKEEYHIQIDYSRAGSFDMITADLSGRDYLFPSSQTALELYNDTYGKPIAEEIIFNTPIVLYSHKNVADALEREGVVSQVDGVYYADMEKLTELMLNETTWSEIGLPELYGTVLVDTTDPTKSNSGNMFAALLANVLNDGKTIDESTVHGVMPELKSIFSRMGYMETSSSDLFNQFIRMGVGGKPIIAGYESQLLEYAAENPEEYEKIKDDIVMIYPTPTVWSTHVYIALDEEGKQGIDALLDSEVQRLAWEKHGFRTGGYDISSEGGFGNVVGVAQQPTGVMNMPDYEVMMKIIEGLK